MLREHARNHNVWTLTDQPDELPTYKLRLRHGYTGWWSKLELFAPHMRHLRPFLFLDLDTVVRGEILDILAWRPGRLAILSDFYRPDHQQSAMMVVPDYDDGIWGKIRPDTTSLAGGDQEFIEACVPDAIRLQDHFEGLTSFKVHCKKGPVGRVVAFHGEPKPHNCDAPWVRDIWASSSSF